MIEAVSFSFFSEKKFESNSLLINNRKRKALFLPKNKTFENVNKKMAGLKINFPFSFTKHFSLCLCVYISLH